MYARANIMNWVGRCVSLIMALVFAVVLVGGAIAAYRDVDYGLLALFLLATIAFIPTIIGLIANRRRLMVGISLVLTSLVFLGYYIVDNLFSGSAWTLRLVPLLISGVLLAAGVLNVLRWRRQGGSVTEVLARATMYVKLGLAVVLWEAFAFALALVLALRYHAPANGWDSTIFSGVFIIVTLFGLALFFLVTFFVHYARGR